VNNLCLESARSLSGLLQRGEISAIELLELHLTQISQHNQYLNAVVTLTEDLAREQAKRSDQRRHKKQCLGPLDGLPVAVKDKFHMKGVRTTNGSLYYSDTISDEDDLIVARERAAGLVCMGKTNLPEFSFGGHTENPIFGATVNPFDFEVSVSGSSGGSAVAVAAGLAALANGSDIAGSLRAPAAWCNVVGFRPTPGRIPSTRRNFLWEEFSVHGPMARTVGDIVMYMSAIAGPSDRAPVSFNESANLFSQSLSRDWSGVRVAWSVDLSSGHDPGVDIEPEMAESIQSVKPVFEALGLDMKLDCPPVKCATELLNQYKSFVSLHRVGHIIDKRPSMFKKSIHDFVEVGRCLSAQDIVEMDRKRGQLWSNYQSFFDHYDYLIWPSSPCNPRSIHSDEYGLKWSMLDPQPLLGLPCISVPCGFSSKGHPVGIQITGKRGDDLGVLQLAYAFECETEFWKQTAPCLKR
jgi:amidase